ncbi:MAG: hypothetical protein F6K09_01385 [Merismopedia sp. SIO2A8]|nr:hypothetical protein [Merismopedia sp. SIO2A8]
MKTDDPRSRPSSAQPSNSAQPPNSEQTPLAEQKQMPPGAPLSPPPTICVGQPRVID